MRSLSASGPPALAALAASRGKPVATETSELVRRLLAKRKGPLTAEERRFLAKVRTVYARCRQAGHITHWDFEEMGLQLGGYGWNALQIWPAVPEDEYQFWLYVAHAAQAQNVPIPEFMRPITDLSEHPGSAGALGTRTRDQALERAAGQAATPGATA